MFVVVSRSQVVSMSSGVGVPSYQSLFPDSKSSSGSTHIHRLSTVSEEPLSSALEVPSDPDEPFFILSLTEIPVCSSGEVLASAPKPLPYLAGPDVSIQQQRLVLLFIRRSSRPTC